MKKLLLVFLTSVLLLSCNNQEDDLKKNELVAIATIENPKQVTNFYLNLDNNKRLWTFASNLAYYRPKDGQRVIANYSVLTNKSDTSSYNHDVHLNNVYEILTKGIFKIKPAEQDSIGNDQIEIIQLWIGGEFLNLEFNYPGNNKIHFINLVMDSTKTYTDNKIHLEFRHNANGDYPSISKWGMVSFDLRSLKLNAASDSINLVIHTNEYRAPQNISYNLTYKFNADILDSALRINIPKNVAKVQ